MKINLKSKLTASASTILILLMCGCSIVDLRSETAQGANIHGLGNFYVSWLEGDSRHLETIIRDEIRLLGYQAECGKIDNLPLNADALVTYEDRWFWDMSNYLLQLNIEIRDPKTRFPYAVGESVRTSLARKDPPEVAREILQKIFYDGK